MPRLFEFSQEEQSWLQGYDLRWADAVTIIAKQMVADEASGELAAKRQDNLATPLSPRERQELYEAVRAWFRKKHRVTQKVPAGESIGKVTARTIFCRTKPRTIREIQKRLFEKDQTVPFPYSVDKVVDKELVKVTEEEMLAIDDGSEEDEEDMVVDGDDIGEYGGEEDELGVPKRSGSVTDHGDLWSESGSGSAPPSLLESAPAPTAKEIANLAFRYYQQAVTIALSDLPEAERNQYVLKAKVARAKGLSIEDKKRNVETSLTHAMRKGAEHLWNHFGVKVVYAITFEDKEGTIRAVVQDFNEELGGGASFVKQNDDFLEESGFYTAPRAICETVEWLVALFRTFITIHYGKEQRSSPPWSDMAARPDRYFSPEVLAEEYTKLIKEPSKMGKTNLLKVLKHLYSCQEDTVQPRFQMKDNQHINEENAAQEVTGVQKHARKRTKPKPVTKQVHPPIPSPQATPGISRSPTPAPRDLPPFPVVPETEHRGSVPKTDAAHTERSKPEVGLHVIPESGGIARADRSHQSEEAVGTLQDFGGLPAAIESDEELLPFEADIPAEGHPTWEATTKELVELSPGVWASSPVRKPIVSASHRIQMQFKPKQLGRTLQGIDVALKQGEHVDVRELRRSEPAKRAKKTRAKAGRGGKQVLGNSKANQGDEQLQAAAEPTISGSKQSTGAAQDDGWVEEADDVPKRLPKQSPRKRSAAPVLVGLAKDRVRREPKTVKRIS
ncbi:hypothetical protein BKA70DRAFT_1218693 [Coprinopsis sp. MPI-PUGE-AT-0042]|nr:hypothetical protein BKA70DRAFT_1218693 [Coprinopsis sp. MPI-PUGE-AT-0042]